jgi:hypothetical protein
LHEPISGNSARDGREFWRRGTMDQSETSRERAHRRLLEAEALVVQQAEHVDDLKRRGQDTKDAEEVLVLLKEAAKFMHEDLALLRPH